MTDTAFHYYMSLSDVQDRLGGANPRIIKAEKVVGAGSDGLLLSGEGVKRLDDGDPTYRVRRKWHIGVLISRRP